MAFAIEIKKLKENKLLNRKEMDLILTHTRDSTPKKEDVIAKLAALYQSTPKNIIITDVKGKFGSHISTGKAKVYNNFEQLETVERTFQVVRKTGVKVKKVVRRMRKDIRKKKSKMFGSLRRNKKKQEKKEKK
ncbi:eukaryotic ribosomal protein eS24-like protein [Binucleata daphniae]